MRTLYVFIYLAGFHLAIICGCKNRDTNQHISLLSDSSWINTKHLDDLFIPVIFPDGVHASGVAIYSEAPDYHVVGAEGEGSTCVDDVSRAALFYARNKIILTDTATQHKLLQLVHFILEMQSENGYFYNFLLPGNIINKEGKTSTNTANWWSWRAFQTLTEVLPIVEKIDLSLAGKIELVVNKVIVSIKKDIPDSAHLTKKVEGLIVPQWLPAGSASDQASILMLALINYCTNHVDTILHKYIHTLADGISLMQQGNENHFPYSCFLSWENVWHAYGCDQSYALMQAGIFLKDTNYIVRGIQEVKNFYPWLLKGGMKSSFSIKKNGPDIIPMDEKEYPQIAYGIRPMLFAASEAFALTHKEIYADIAAHLCAWFFTNEGHIVMYNKNNGVCYDGIVSKNLVNKNSGAESTIEALLSFQRMEKYPEIMSAIKKYRN